MQITHNGAEFDNVFIYVSDSLRFDSVPQPIADKRQTIKTASTGLATPEAMSSLVTGLHPHQHGVWRFTQQFSPDTLTLFDLFPNASYQSPLEAESTIVSNIFGVETFEETPPGEMTPPFLAIIRDNSAHAPYAGASLPSTLDGDEDVDPYEAYWADRKGDQERIRSDYLHGARHSADRFLNVVESLEENDMLNSTLVIFTADHGELLGEYGLVDHGMPTCPELVYVPTVFWNDSITVDGSFLSLVDLFPTIVSLTDAQGVTPSEFPGYDLTEGTPKNRLANNHVQRFQFSERSVWDENGGHVFSDDSLYIRVRLISRMLRKRSTAPYTRRHVITASKTLLQRDRVVGSPGFSTEQAESFIESLGDNTTPSRRTQLDEQTIEQLEHLGYREGDEI